MLLWVKSSPEVLTCSPGWQATHKKCTQARPHTYTHTPALASPDVQAHLTHAHRNIEAQVCIARVRNIEAQHAHKHRSTGAQTHTHTHTPALAISRMHTEA
jgi:hypothetical protein